MPTSKMRTASTAIPLPAEGWEQGEDTLVQL